MIWAILVAFGVPLWLCAIGILTLVVQNQRVALLGPFAVSDQGQPARV